MGLDFDDRDRAVALEIHVERVGDRKNREQPHVNPTSQDQPGDDAERDIRRGGPERSDEDSRFPTNFVDERTIDQKRERVSNCTGCENKAEIFVRHERAERVLGQ